MVVNWARSGENLDAALQKEWDRLNERVGQLLQVARAEGDPEFPSPLGATGPTRATNGGRFAYRGGRPRVPGEIRESRTGEGRGRIALAENC